MPEESSAILAVAARVPPFALAAETVDRAYGRSGGRGGRRFASYDEDALTLAAAAGERCLEGFDRSAVKALYVASTTWPRAAAAQAERLAMALDLPDTVEVATFGGSWRCGAAALRLALLSPRAPALVIAADRLGAPPGSDRETTLGDGAAAVLVGRGAGRARVGAWTSRLDITDWDSADARFLVEQAVRLASMVPRGEATRAAVSAPGLRAARAAAAALRIPCTDAAMEWIGFCGAAHPLLALAEILESARSGERVLWVACGDGLEAALIDVAAPLESRTFAGAMEKSQPVKEYGLWLASRTFFDGDAMRSAFSSPAMEHRDADFLLRLHGARCPACGATHTLPAPVCARCGAGGSLARVPLSRAGTIFTFTHEYYVPSPSPPVTMAVVDLEGGGRILVQVADAAPEDVRAGAKVRLAPRRLHMGGGVPNYYWKAVLA